MGFICVLGKCGGTVPGQSHSQPEELGNFNHTNNFKSLPPDAIHQPFSAFPPR
jgi:hypothetical protein